MFFSALKLTAKYKCCAYTEISIRFLPINGSAFLQRNVAITPSIKLVNPLTILATNIAVARRKTCQFLLITTEETTSILYRFATTIAFNRDQTAVSLPSLTPALRLVKCRVSSRKKRVNVTLSTHQYNATWQDSDSYDSVFMLNNQFCPLWTTSTNAVTRLYELDKQTRYTKTASILLGQLLRRYLVTFQMSSLVFEGYNFLSSADIIWQAILQPLNDVVVHPTLSVFVTDSVYSIATRSSQLRMQLNNQISTDSLKKIIIGDFTLWLHEQFQDNNRIFFWECAWVYALDF